MKTTLQPNSSVSEQIQEILHNRIDSCRQALHAADPHQGIHDARKQLKKIRSVVRIVREDIPKEQYQRINTYFRDVGRMLSDARDTSALLDVVMTLHGQVEAPEVKKLLERVVHYFMAKKAAVTRYQINRDQLLQQTLRAFVPAEEYIQPLNIRHEGFSALAASILKVYQRGQQMKDESRKNPNPETYHEWRKRVKYLRYQVNMLSPMWPPMMNALEDELHELTDALGADHDLYMLHETILHSNLKEEEDWSPLFHFISTQRKRQEIRAHTLGKKLYYWKPSHFVGWLQASWSACQLAEPAQEESLIAV